MNASMIILLIKNLGRPYESLISEGVIPNIPLRELYEGRDWLDIEPEDGVELSFATDSRCLETLYVILAQTVEGQPVYRGKLPSPLALSMNKADIQELFGMPLESKGPTELPLNRKTGGWDAYKLDSTIHSRAKMIFKYAQDYKVNTLVFTLYDE